MTKPLWLRAEKRSTPAVDGWVELVRLVPADLDQVPQHAGLGSSGDWFLTQGRVTGHAFEDLTVSRFSHGGTLVGSMRVPQGGHGDRMIMRDDDVGVYIQHTWCWLPWETGKSWTVASAQEHRGTRRRLGLAARQYCQGEVDLDDTWLRLYGGSIKGGAERDPSHPLPFVEVIRHAQVESRIDLDHLGRDGLGDPLGGRFEPEGIIAADVDGEPWILVGFAVGRLQHTVQVVYGRPTSSLVAATPLFGSPPAGDPAEGSAEVET